MIVDIPFVYTATVIPPRCRNPVDVQVLDRIPLKLNVPEGGEFPVALRLVLGDRLSTVDEEATKKALDNPVEIRWNGRALFDPWRYSPHSQDDGSDHGLDQAEIQRRLNDGRSTPFGVEQQMRRYGYERVRTVNPDQVQGRLLCDDRRERVAAILEKARDVVFCDGTFFTPCEEPVWRVDTDRRYPRVEAKFGHDHDIACQPENFYRADQLEDALTAAGENVTQSGVIEVLIPEALRLRLDDLQLIRGAKSAVDGLRDDLGDATVPFFTAYARLRDTLKDHPADAVSQELAEAITGMIKEMPERFDYEMDNWRRDRLVGALTRWQDALLRDAALEAAEAPLLPDLR